MAKVLVIGSGGREHALCYKFKQSKHVDEVFVAPGNPGMSDVATIVNINQLDFTNLIKFVKENKIDLTFVGTEIPLCEGIVDEFEKENLSIFGPSKSAAMLEGSKVFSKQMMDKYHIPTAKYQSFSDYNRALEYLCHQEMPIVIKADGLAAGKGVVIPTTLDEAKELLKSIMCNHLFEEAGNNVVIEEYLEGEEFSLLAFVNDKLVVPMEIAQDHKRAFDNDCGLNTGGMGAYTPVSHLPQEAITDAVNKIIKPMAEGLSNDGNPFKGILYGGCMLTKNGVKTIEYNVRFGDPETEVLLLSLENDLYEVITSVMNNKKVELKWSKEPYIGVVLANKGYPEAYKKGAVIEGLDDVNATVFHMGTSCNSENQIIATGGRVLFIACAGRDLKQAKDNVYEEIKKIKCDSLFYRTDIGNKGIN